MYPSNYRKQDVICVILAVFLKFFEKLRKVRNFILGGIEIMMKEILNTG